MGRDLGRAALMRGPVRPFSAVLVGVLVTVALAGLGAGTAAADPIPTPTPTPSVSPPSQQQIDDAKAALDRLRNQGKGTPTQPAGLTQVAGPTDASGRRGVTSRISDQAWWTIAAAVLLLVVVSETTRVSVRRAKHRKGA